MLLKTRVASMTVCLEDNSQDMDEESNGYEEIPITRNLMEMKKIPITRNLMEMKAIMKRMLKILKRKVGKRLMRSI